MDLGWNKQVVKFISMVVQQVWWYQHQKSCLRVKSKRATGKMSVFKELNSREYFCDTDIKISVLLIIPISDMTWIYSKEWCVLRESKSEGYLYFRKRNVYDYRRWVYSVERCKKEKYTKQMMYNFQSKWCYRLLHVIKERTAENTNWWMLQDWEVKNNQWQYFLQVKDWNSWKLNAELEHNDGSN